MTGADRGETTLFPAQFDEWIDSDNPVRVVDAFVNVLALGNLEFPVVVPEIAGLP